jgi:asparagine synthase (glutamine-hydrolysing)
MSGLCGIVTWEGSRVEADAVERMARMAPHRGAGGVDCWTRENAGLAGLCTRKTQESAHRGPLIHDPFQQCVLAVDARLDNRRDLIDLLNTHGQPIDARSSDAEIILAAWRSWGTETPCRLIGDFAFVVWDYRRQTVFAARDAMAMRPVYYHSHSGRFVFASQIDQILSVPGVPAEIFEPMAAAYLSGPYGKPEWTLYRHIAALPPSHALEANASGVRIWKYWDVDPAVRIRHRKPCDYAEQFREIFKEAVHCRLRSLQPVGLLLSGGMDSGSIASTAGWLRGHGGLPCPHFRCYSWAFQELGGDERWLSDGIVRHYGLDAGYVPADDRWPLKDYPESGPDRDDPYIWPYQSLIDATFDRVRRDGIGTLLSGDRGDEVVGDWVYDLVAQLLTGDWRGVWRDLELTSRSSGVSLLSAVRRRLLAPLWESLRSPKHLPALRGARSGGRNQRPEWVRPEWARKMRLDEIMESTPAVNGFRNPALRLRHQRIFSYSGMRLAVFQERRRAAYGLSYADPWSDRRVISFILAIPQSIVQQPSQPKKLAREAMRGIMPEAVRQGARRITPDDLYDRGVRERERARIVDLFTHMQSAARGWLDEAQVQRAYQDHLNRRPLRWDIWWPLTLEMWLRRYWS